MSTGRAPWEEDDEPGGGPMLPDDEDGNEADARAALGLDDDEVVPAPSMPTEHEAAEAEEEVQGPFARRRIGEPRPGAAHQVTLDEAIEEADGRSGASLPGSRTGMRDASSRRSATTRRPGSGPGDGPGDAPRAPRRGSGPNDDTMPLPDGPGDDWGTGQPAEFESAERVTVKDGALAVTPALRMLSDGMAMLAIAKAPSTHYTKGGLGQQLLQGMGSAPSAVPPSQATRRDPHDAAKRPPAILVDPPTQVSKEAILPPRFSAGMLDDLIPEVEEGGLEPVLLTKASSVPEPRLPAPSLAPEGLAAVAGALAGLGQASEGDVAVPLEPRAPDGPESQAGLLFHRPVVGGDPTRSLKGEKSASATYHSPSQVPERGNSSHAAIAAQKATPHSVKLGPSGGIGLKHLALTALVSAAVAWFVVPRVGAAPAQDAVVVYALAERDRGVAYLNEEIQAVEGQVAETEAALNREVLALGPTPQADAVARLERLGRLRNRQVIALEALRTRRMYLMGGSNGR